MEIAVPGEDPKDFRKWEMTLLVHMHLFLVEAIVKKIEFGFRQKRSNTKQSFLNAPGRKLRLHY